MKKIDPRVAEAKKFNKLLRTELKNIGKYSNPILAEFAIKETIGCVTSLIGIWDITKKKDE